jgi:hypothetical protein
MSNASHRHVKAAVKTPRVPWGHLAAVAVLIGALFAGLMLAASLTAPPAQASTSYLVPAVTAAKAVGHGRVTQWQRVLRHCRKVGCTSHVPDAMRRDMGIKAGQVYRVHWGDTTFAWVRLPHGRVRTITS